jgi:N4-gp56 family major capsid protein
MAYSPASAVIGSGLPSSQAIYYDRAAIENLKAHLPFVTMTTRRPLPKRSGKTIQLFEYDLFAANTTPGTEGTVGTGLAPTQHSLQATVGQYFDFVSFSDMLVETAIDPIVENVSKELGYRAALTVNTLTQLEFDAAVGVDSTIRTDLADGIFLTAATIRARTANLLGRNAKPLTGGYFGGIIHPFAAADVFNDTANNGLTDILKRTEVGQRLLQDGPTNDGDYQVVDFAGVRWVMTTTAPSYANVPSAGHTAYGSYIVAKDAVISVSLGATEVPGEKNFGLSVSTFKPSASDPAGVIASAAAYNFKFVSTVRPGTVMTLEEIRAESAIS